MKSNRPNPFGRKEFDRFRHSVGNVVKFQIQKYFPPIFPKPGYEIRSALRKQPRPYFYVFYPFPPSPEEIEGFFFPVLSMP